MSTSPIFSSSLFFIFKTLIWRIGNKGILLFFLSQALTLENKKFVHDDYGEVAISNSSQKPSSGLIQKTEDSLIYRRIKSKLVSNDTSIINNTQLKVYCLFDSKDSTNIQLDFGPFLFQKIHIYKNDPLSFQIAGYNFQIKSEGIYLGEFIDSNLVQKLSTHSFQTNREIKTLENGEFEISYVLEKYNFQSQLGDIDVERKQMRCDDTGRNPISIKQGEKRLLIKEIGNLIFFEYDVDGDGENEIYVINYFSCLNKLKVFKITN